MSLFFWFIFYLQHQYDGHLTSNRKMDNTEHKSSRARKRERIRTKEEMDYDKNPPRCEICIHRQKEKLAIPKVRQYLPAYCKIGKFVVTPVGVCKVWKGTNGDTLEE